MRYVYKQRHYRKYLITLSATIALVGGIAFGTLGNIVDAASRYGHFVQPGVQRSQSISTTKPGTTTTIIPATTPAAPAPTPTTTSPAATSSPVTPVTKAPVVTSQPIAPAAPPDTAAASQTTTTSQASTTALAKPVTYENHQLSAVMRSQLMMLAGIVGFVGLTLYSLTLIRRPKAAPHAVPMTRVIPVESVSR